jgi:para-aminobenzoate synthetase component 1
LTQTTQQTPPVANSETTTHALLAPGFAQPNTNLSILQTHLIPPSDPDPISTLQALLDTHPDRLCLITLAYDLAHTIEPTVSSTRSTFPHIIAQRCAPTPPSHTTNKEHWSINPDQLTLTPKSHYISIVQQALDYIAAGDIYQVNLAHPITVPFQGCAHSLASHLFKHTNPEMGSFTCFDNNQTRHAVISLSPETFLTYDAPTRTLTTIPMKGTSPASTNPNDLYHNPKDRAELNMIIDLMRNDLARISIPSSVRVTNPRAVHTHHNSVHQATATIQSTLRDNLNLSDILRATFPPGSITGAPKVRAMQIIHELETSTPNPIPRAPYCGTTIALAPDGSFKSAVNIRTIHIQGTPSKSSPHAFQSATLTYHTGAGIVADSDPEAEWNETLTKAQILKTTLDLPLPTPS